MTIPFRRTRLRGLTTLDSSPCPTSTLTGLVVTGGLGSLEGEVLGSDGVSMSHRPSRDQSPFRPTGLRDREKDHSATLLPDSTFPASFSDPSLLSSLLSCPLTTSLGDETLGLGLGTGPGTWREDEEGLRTFYVTLPASVKSSQGLTTSPGRPS